MKALSLYVSNVAASISAALIAIGIVLFGLSGAAVAVPINAKVNGTVDFVAGPSSEPFVGLGDSYNANLSFEIEQTGGSTLNAAVSNVSGTAVINGISTGFTGFNGVWAASPGAVRVQFFFTPFGQGPGLGNVNLDILEIVFRATSVSSSYFFDIVSATDAFISSINIAGRQETATGENGIFNLSRNAQSEISSIPEPFTIALFGLGIAGLGFTRRWKS